MTQNWRYWRTHTHKMPKKFIAVIEISDSEDEITIVPNVIPEPILIELSDDDDEIEMEAQIQNQQQNASVSDSDEAQATEAPFTEDKIQLEDTDADNKNLHNNSEQFSNEEEENSSKILVQPPNIPACSDDVPAVTPMAMSSSVNDSQSATESRDELNQDVYNRQSPVDIMSTPIPRNSFVLEKLPGSVLASGTSNSSPMNNGDSPSLPMIRISTAIFDEPEKVREDTTTSKENPDPGTSAKLIGEGNDAHGEMNRDMGQSKIDEPHTVTVNCATPMVKKPKTKRKRPNAAGAGASKTDLAIPNFMNVLGAGTSTDDSKSKPAAKETSPPRSHSPAKTARKRRRKDDVAPRPFCLTIDECFSFVPSAEPGAAAADQPLTLDLLMKPPEVASLRVPKKRNRKQTVPVPKVPAAPITGSMFQISQSPLLPSDQMMDNSNLMEFSHTKEHKSNEDSTATPKTPLKATSEDEAITHSTQSELVQISKEGAIPEQTAEHYFSTTSYEASHTTDDADSCLEQEQFTSEASSVKANFPKVDKNALFVISEDPVVPPFTEVMDVFVSRQEVSLENDLPLHPSAEPISYSDQQFEVTNENETTGATSVLPEKSYEASCVEQAAIHSVSDDLQATTETYTSLESNLHQSNLVIAASTNEEAQSFLKCSAESSNVFPVDSAAQDSVSEEVSKLKQVVRSNAEVEENEICMLPAPRPVTPELITVIDEAVKVIEPALQNSRPVGFPPSSFSSDSKLTLRLLSSEWNILFPNSPEPTVKIDEAHQGILCILSNTFHVRISISEKSLMLTIEGADRKRRTLARDNMLYWLECQAGGIAYTLQYIKPKKSKNKKKGYKRPKLQVYHKSKNSEMRHRSRMQSNGHSNQYQCVRNGSLNNQFNSFGSCLPGPCYPNPAAFPLYPRTQQIPHSQFSQQQSNQNEFLFNPQQLGPHQAQATYNNNNQDFLRRQEVPPAHSDYRFYHPYRRFNSSPIQNHDGNNARNYHSNTPGHPTYRMSL